MGQLFDARQKLDAIIAQKNLDPVNTRGAIGMKAGFLLSMVNASTPDDPAKLDRLRQAVKDVLNMTL